MQDNRNCGSPVGLGLDGRGMVCIDTKRVLDCCRDRDCFEDSRVYLTAFGEEIIASATAIRTKSAQMLCAQVAIEEVPFNCGFYQIKVKYYIEVEVEACLGLGRSQTVNGLATLEKDVVLYGGEGTVTSYYSGTNSGFCTACDPDLTATNAPTAVVDTVEPVVLGTKLQECCCPQSCCDCGEVPSFVSNIFDGELVTNSTSTRLLVSFGIFSVIRLVRPAQLLVAASDYSVPDKECTAATSNDNPCELFKTMAFPVSRFQANMCNGNDNNTQSSSNNGGCGCNKRQS